MAYPNYNNYNPVYQSPYNQPSIYPQPQQYNVAQPQQNMVQPNSAGIEVRYATESEATNYLVEPNKKILFIITDKPMSIYKATDPMGISSVKRYKMEEMSNLSTEVKSIEFDPKEFVKHDDLGGFVTNDVLDQKLSSFSATISKQIEELKKSVKIKNIIDEGK